MYRWRKTIALLILAALVLLVFSSVASVFR
jgi:hypothetical protein